jgi:putative PIN family toxin of toxin-antitoxin system
MIRVVLDVNVIVSGFPQPLGIPATIIERWLRREFELFTSEHILSGVVRAWNKPYFRSRYQLGEVERAIALLRQRATVVIPTTIPEDLEDDLVLGTGLAANASCLVTGDRGLLRLDRYEGLALISPNDFLALLEQVNQSE